MSAVPAQLLDTTSTSRLRGFFFAASALPAPSVHSNATAPTTAVNRYRIGLLLSPWTTTP